MTSMSQSLPLTVGLDPVAEARQIACCIAEKFHPVAIWLFGSVAQDLTTEDSDIDLLIVMEPEQKSAVEQAADICLSCRGTFPLDLRVIAPDKLASRLEAEHSFYQEVVEHGVLLYAR
ncbi:MAG: hypothetical protein GEEBNDBF_02672 [bacterium]|nr:hypothetical protein [bacterium]